MVVPAAGLTLMLEPVPTEVPPQEPVNHCQPAPEPREPPVTVRVLEVPLQVLLLVTVMPVGATDNVFIVTAREAAAEVPQLLPAVTVMLPPVVPEVTVIEVVPAPAVMLHPEGTVQV